MHVVARASERVCAGMAMHYITYETIQSKGSGWKQMIHAIGFVLMQNISSLARSSCDKTK